MQWLKFYFNVVIITIMPLRCFSRSPSPLVWQQLAESRCPRVICFQLLKDPVVHSAAEPNREAPRRWTSSGRMKDWRPVIDFFSLPPPVFSRFCVIPWQTDDVRWKHYLFHSGLFSPSDSCDLNFEGSRERWTQIYPIIRSVASNILLQGGK